MSTIHYAVETFIPGATSEILSIGMIVDPVLGYSVIRTITDRPQYDGETNFPTWEDESKNVVVWYGGILSKENLGNPNRFIDLTGTGGYGTMSGFTFDFLSPMIAGTTKPIWKKLEDAGIVLYGCIVKFYVVLDDVFYSGWQGIINETPYTETSFKFVCKSDFKAVHKSIPPETVNDTNYPDADSESKGKALPICLGRVPYARIINTTGNPEFLTLIEDADGYEYEAAQATALTIGATGNVLTLKTPRKAPVCTGLYLIVVAGGGSPDTKRCYKIKESTNLITPDPANNLTYIILDDSLDVEYATFNASYIYGSATYADIWQFKIIGIGRESIVSNGAISEFKTKYNRIQAFDYDQQAKQYISSSSIVSGEIGAPTIVTTDSNIVTIDGTVKKLIPCDITVDSVANSYTWPQPPSPTIPVFTNQTGDKDDCADLSRATGYFIRVGGDVQKDVDTHIYITSKITLPISYKERSFERLWILADYQLSNGDVYNGTQVFRTNRVMVTFKDQYGTSVNVVHDVPLSTSDTATINRILLPNSYYENNGDTNSVASQFGVDINLAGFIPKVEFEISEDYVKYFKNGIFKNAIEIQIRYTNLSVGAIRILNRSIKLFELGVIIEREVDTIGTSLYTRVNGEVLSSGGEKTDTVYRALYKLAADYDGLTVGTGDLTKDVDMSNLYSYRGSVSGFTWYFGYQFLEKKNSFDYWNSICESSFCAMFQTRTGQKRITAWIDRDDFNHPTHSGSIIVRDSIDSFQKTKSADTYNEFFIRFNYDPETNKCNRSILITKVSEASFPLEATLDANGQPVWYSYVGGIPTYAAAKWLWDGCHAKWEKTHVVNQMSVDLPYFPDLKLYEDNPAETDGVGLDSSAYRFLTYVIAWMMDERVEVKYSLPLNSQNIIIEPCDPVRFTDVVFTNGDLRVGWIEGVEIDTKNDVLIITTILEATS